MMFTGSLRKWGSGPVEGEAGILRLQGLVHEVQGMEDTLGVSDFPAYFVAVRELKDLLVEEFNGLYEAASKQNVEIERMNIMVEEKNKAISTLADSNEEERKELKKLRVRVKELEQELEEQKQGETKLKRMIARMKRSSISSSSNPPDESLLEK